MYAGSIPTPASSIRKFVPSVISRKITPFARMVKLVDTRDLKSLGPKTPIPVRFRFRAPPQHSENADSHMIVYDLECENSHRFEGWFGSAGDYDQQLAGKLLSCPMCNSGNVVRRPSASYVNTGAVERPSRERPNPPDSSSVNVPRQYANVAPEIVAKVIEHIVKNTEDVGNRFPEEARKIYYNEAPERHIRGTASARDVASLRDEGIDVVSLPVPPHLVNKTH